ncbi:MAG: hypothetical protein CM1200mP28_08070 [Deltaproteobacteria bacterium]|nr:MAG: hypothetical protein CM1200mP28_08070 [Deltaproteobacteria bacterium]
MADSLRILGIDPGSRKTGYGLIEHSGNKSRHLDSGFIRLNEKETLSERLFILSRELGKIIDKLNPIAEQLKKFFMPKMLSLHFL